MKNDLQQLDHWFQAVQFDPSVFSFWLSIYDYVEAVVTSDLVKSIIDNDEKVSREKCAKIYDQSNDTESFHAIKISKIESMSLYYNFIELEQIYFAFKEMENKHEGCLGGDCRCSKEAEQAWKKELAEGAVKFEKELYEIYQGKISKDNELVNNADYYFEKLKFVHSRLMKELSKKEPVKKLEKDMSLRFDDKNGLLYVEGHKVRIKRQDNINNGHLILREIFKDLTSGHSYGFLYADMTQSDYKDSKTNWKKIHRACLDVNDKVRGDTDNTIHDFLIFNTGISGKVKINPKYLEK